ncbi:DUF6624 domain-containing protein [Mucilaginibacter sp. KACC 22063]|uniref:DUF6624 domain-containing protein n=1 Tax=Mucilaginibacter sp. KACC 22063 TaxID=3025666 RepID=UPI002365D29C|nr:DUF6624 domain-containing protein [Mucilaginibacter sp. KACC 22063]WDF55869.1 hypothetical protein PQ461_02185 [Mucilaginibacter sp. KACC 22063]
MNAEHIAHIITDLKDTDLNLRNKLIRKGKLSDGYDSAMEELHNCNAKILNDLIDQIGYPTEDKVGKEASEAAWLVIQHAIGQPAFMRKCRELLQKAVDENKAAPINLAYLSDRIAVFEEQPQLYGTQFDWDENGELTPNPFDDLTRVNQRRKAIGLNTLEDQIAMIRKRTKEENQLPPKDLEKRKRDVEEWKKKVGWIR